MSNKNNDTLGFAFGLMLEDKYFYLGLLKDKVNKTGNLSSKITQIESLNDFKSVTTISSLEKEKRIEYQQSKKKLASDIIKTDDSFVKSLTKNDIKNLFS